MEPVRFDRIAKLFAGRRLSRRQALTQGGAGLAAGALAAAAPGLTVASAQDATSESAPGGTAAPAMLFVQTYQSGAIAPKEGEPDRYTLTLEQGHGQTVYFSDRPDRIVGADPTPRFLEGMPFPPDNPPNAALVMETAPGETDVAVVELFNPVYDPVTQGVTYEVEVLANWRAELGMQFMETPTDLAALAPSFGSAQLFIDDCPNSDISCLTDEGPSERGTTWGVISANAEMCWNYSLCQPCEPYGHTYPDYCAGYKYWMQKCNAAFNKCGGFWCLPKWNWFQPECCRPTEGC